ncbi:MAG: helix-turn-helix domain-containing protein [Gemmatimonadaceae bacterium]|nr:helix-turn-helix domain-containing protein [Gemmatimonadaceae bacterium]
MLHLAPTLSGFRGIRGELLVTLKREQPLTAAELGARFDLTANGVRRHLKLLEEDGLVRCEREARGVGAPVLAYRLTPGGEALFPREYGPALALALEALRAAKGSEAVTALLAGPWDLLAAEAEPLLAGMALEERMQVLSELLSARGYMASASPAASMGGAPATLKAHNCAMRDVAERVPEVCDAEARFVSRMLGAPVERTQRVLDGANCCTYCVSTIAVADATTSSGPVPLHQEQA